ncbi:MAG: sulfoxide reductase heme-binding subunit YedZ [Acetobacteraceae bacterium]|nr:sulfoxide reductase heme-binding subunit YedZ [Acetobacteraceae bacterium]MSP29655.1 sulfoxide reductase heme-binding subunit YedZ [Acetobacteraceae bacterium]
MLHRPWRDRRGHLVPIKALALALLTIPAFLLALDAAQGALGPRPWNQAIHVTGLWAERLILVTLALTPLRVVLDWPRLVFIRRISGIGALAYVALHLVLYIIDLKFNWAQILWETFTRLYLIIGVLAALGLLALGISSTDSMTQRLGLHWKRLHRLSYPIAVLTGVHYLLQTKANIGGPALAFGVLFWLLLWHLLTEKHARHALALLALGACAALFVAAAEAAWYGLATGLNWRRVLAANLDQFEYIRPSGEGFLIALAVVALALLRRYGPAALNRVPWRLSSRPWRVLSR